MVVCVFSFVVCNAILTSTVSIHEEVLLNIMLLRCEKFDYTQIQPPRLQTRTKLRYSTFHFPRFRYSIRRLRIPSGDQVFYYVRLVLAPDQSTYTIPPTSAVCPENSICRHATDAHPFCFGSKFAELGLNIWRIRLRNESRTIIPTLCEYVSQNRFVANIRVLLPARRIW
jgi:hypothetical protein